MGGTAEAESKDDDAAAVHNHALHVISTNQTALSNLLALYKHDASAISSFTRATEMVCVAHAAKGRVVVSGMGKSGIISNKLVACLNSLGIASVFLHPAEALHGDLGTVGADDVLIILSFSGRSPELMELMSHMSIRTPVIAISGSGSPHACPLLSRHPQSTVVPVPIHEPESVSFGVPLPSTSTAVTLVVCDALALAAAHRVHTSAGHSIAHVFHRLHPGGAIGLDATGHKSGTRDAVAHTDLSRLATPVAAIPTVRPSQADGRIRTLDVLRAAVRTSHRWVRVGLTQFIGPRRMLELSVGKGVCDDDPLASGEENRVCVPHTWSLDECRQHLVKWRRVRPLMALRKGIIVCITADMRAVGVVEMEDVVEEGSAASNNLDHVRSSRL
ncbi:sugar isomerase, KpsF/GutQ [Aspergillus terreus]|uniref:Sugar isomerase, KpsF/GutQ n=1 Tax=Aspergillus terreus TaxID=33178 RepID=A0A5M3YZV8_ASPTE|nr:hypothetical protein ATETN484_0007000100 [Aspergillus terreus]GFF19342.1 sugar isomerase, KpsF/GutQ [Aspergillus terreus]